MEWQRRETKGSITMVEAKSQARGFRGQTAIGIKRVDVSVNSDHKDYKSQQFFETDRCLPYEMRCKGGEWIMQDNRARIFL